MPYAANKDVRLYYETYGRQGPWVVFAHGGGGNAASWFQQIPYFGKDHRVLVFDHRGFARSRCHDDVQDTKYFADDLLAIMDDAGVDRATLVGQSMGGATCTQAAVQYPDRIRGVVMANTFIGVATQSVLDSLAAMNSRIAESKWLAPFSKTFATERPDMAILYRQIMAHNGEVRLTLDGLALDDLSWPTPQTIKISGVPFFFMGGEYDLSCPATLVQSIANESGAAYEFINGVGHSPYFEAPQVFNEMVADCLAKWEVKENDV